MWHQVITHLKARPWQSAGILLLLLVSPGKKFIIAKRYLTPVAAGYLVSWLKKAMPTKLAGVLPK